MEAPKVELINIEIDAMSKVAGALTPLSDEAKRRVIEWASGLFGVKNISVKEPANNDQITSAEEKGTLSIANLPELFDLVDPKSTSDKALAVAYWLQVHEGQDGLSSQSVNKELKHLGHGVGNITNAFSSLLSEKLALQIQKSGKSQQARKVYKLTRKGILQIENLIKQ